MQNSEGVDRKLKPMIEVIDQKRKGRCLGGITSERSLLQAQESEVLVEIICDNLSEDHPWFEFNGKQ